MSSPGIWADDALKFFKSCRLPIQVTTAEEFEVVKSQFPKSILRISTVDARVDMYILPTHISMWPTFYASSRRKTADKHLFFHRVGSNNRLRFDICINELKDGVCVACTGITGIGKSTEYNAYLMTLLANIGNDGWPKEVWYRFDVTVLKFSLYKGIPRVVEGFCPFNELATQTEDYHYDNIRKEDCPVVLTDANENDSDPQPGIATFIQVTNIDADTKLKTFDKSEARILLIEPPSVEDICHMACFQGRFGTESVFAGMSEADILRIVKKRADLVGPIPRAVFKTEEAFDAFVHYNDRRIDYVFRFLGSSDPTNVPRELQTYISPYMEDETTEPNIYPSFLRPLSPHIAKLISEACKQKEKRIMLHSNKNFRNSLRKSITKST